MLWRIIRLQFKVLVHSPYICNTIPMQTSATGCMIRCRQMANIKWITLDDLSQGWENLCNKLVKSDNQSSLTEKGNWRKSCFFVFFGLLHCFCCNGQKHFIQQSWHHNKGIPLKGLPLFFRSRKFYIWERGGGGGLSTMFLIFPLQLCPP